MLSVAVLAVAPFVTPPPARAEQARQAPEPLPWPDDPPARPAFERAARITDLGRRLFNDTSLSASGRMACATCHVPEAAFSAPDPAPVRMGGPALDQPGTRMVPTLKYMASAPPFTEHFMEEDTGEIDNGPGGGYTWDGRADRASAQARIPLLAPNEMANPDPRALVEKVAAAPYADEVRALFGDRVFEQPARAFDAILDALETYQQYPPEFSPYTSKFDAFLGGRVALSEQEMRGYLLFEDERRGNCAQCHPSRISGHGTPPLFTDFGIVAVGVPRNPAIPANADPKYFDLGLCGPYREDLKDHQDYCGLFKTPTLRNVALRKAFFHNGVFTSLRDSVAFYVDRDVNPTRWYPIGPDGKVQKYNDLPPEYHENVNTDPPFDRHEGEKPALTEGEIDDIVAFLRTLTDGYAAISNERGH
jgi:cytochrome c peroxidase